MGLFKNNWKDIDIVLLDMTMPVKSGKDTFLEMKAINPDVTVLVMSGFSVDGDVEYVVSQGVKGFIQKPFSLNELCSQISKVLNG